jgi:tartrate dehydratase beta subunit/fumarate hydratase class I family protein
MKKKYYAVLFSVSVLLYLIAIGGVAAYSENEITIKGSVYGTEWNDKGEVTAVSIVTTEGDELFVTHDDKGDELLKLVEQNVLVTGAVLLDDKGKKNFTIHKYEVSYN